ncbi:Serine/Threonine kinase domain protein (macronuclear) [Tetrahymena thermophila SB210]|uniref:dual-specificity kinase n=1 Tax=Tetrahymena thermophila (strain SB210) TaxID=312017 RepID=I7M9U0_TETTS|nr:Serine/Threonine kinase domain protein [Tetrahymena thermophila SB210]EAS02804.2 Serine/Threonine kinase domain protein [Tetrahymena thermophila SB210]|eukprot:XP_001023049.2 Serine/Threonine kinase domain protein [Tetrahymena thermophila SB210]
MNAYKPKFHKKLMISPKNASYDLNFRGFSQGSAVITPQAEKVQSTRNSFAIDQKNKDSILQSNISQPESTKQNHFGYQNQLAHQQIQQQQLQQQQQSLQQMQQQQQQMTLQQSQNQLNQQHQQQLIMMIQQQQQQQHGQQLPNQTSSKKSNQQQQMQQNQIQQSQYSNVLNLLMQQQPTQPPQQHQQIYQNLNNSQQYTTMQQSSGQNYSNQSFTTNRQNSNANYLYHQLNPPQSTKAADSNRRQNNPFSGTYSTKNTSAPQQLLKDILSKINKEQVQQQLPYQQNQQVLRSSHMMNNSQNNSNSNVVILNNNTQNANNQNIYSSNYVNTNPDLSNIYNPNNLAAMNPQPSSTKSNRIHSHYFPATTKNKSNRNPSLDKLNDSSFLRLKNVQSPKQRTIRTIMPGSNRDNSVGNNSSINRNGYFQREYSESGVDASNQYILPASLLQQKTKRSGNSITGGVNNVIANNNNSYNNGSYSKIQPHLPQNQTRQNGTPYVKKDLTIKTGNSIETLKDILSPTNNNANPKTTTATKDSKKHLNSNTLPIQSYTTTHAQQIHQQKRLLQKRDDQKNKSNFINSSFQYIMASENNSVENTNRFSYNVMNNMVANNQGQKLLKNKNNSMENQQFKNLSFTQPLNDQFKQTKENNNTQNSNNKILTVKQQQQKQQLQFIQKGLGQNSSKQNQSSIQTSEGNENKSESNYESQGQNLDNFDQHKIDLSTASQTPFRNGNSTNEKKTLDDNNTRNTERDEKKEEPLDWEKVKVPITPLEVLAKYQKYLTPQEKAEILEFKRIYFIGHNANKAAQENGNNDDTKGDYQYNVNDHIAYRYEIKEFLGKGSFGQVLKVFDHKRKEYAALKVIRNKQKFHEQALIELNILHYIKEKDYDNQTNIVKIRDFVIFRNHVCLVFELLSINLYDLLRNNKFQGLSLELIRRFAIQLLNAISFLKENRIIHCDLKPENVLLKQPNKSGIKIADFGSSCFDDQVMYTYIQSRYYRSPEVILGIPYGTEIDMWSFGCIIAELFLGYPIFPGEDENEQMGYIMELLGAPDSEFLKKCSRKKYFFDQNDQPLQIPNSRGKIRMPNSKNWKSVIGCTDDNFIDFIKKCLVWEPSQRLTPRDALLHPWILDGLPEDIRVQHIKFLKDKSFETASEKEFHKQSCLQAQYNADAQSAAMALALQKIYKYNNKKRILEKKSTTQGTVSEETRNSVMEEKKQTAEVSQMFNNFFIQPESTKNNNKNNQNSFNNNTNNSQNFSNGNPMNDTNKSNSLNQNNFSNNNNNIQNQNNFIILTNPNKIKIPNANSNSLTQKKKITAQILQDQQNQHSFQANQNSQQTQQKLTLQQQQVQLQLQLQKIAQQQKLQKLQ